VLGVVSAGAFLLLAAALLLGGVGLAVTSAAIRDDHGLMRSTPATWTTAGYAVRFDAARFHPTQMLASASHRMMGTLEVSADGEDGRGIFIGIARTRDVNVYLGRAASSMMQDPWDDDGSGSTFTDGDAPAMAPGLTPIWVASSAGPGTQTLRWDPRAGDWTLVVMNEDASAPVTAEVSVAADLPVVDTLSLALIGTGIVVLVVSGVGLVLAIPRQRQTSAAA
jgi:hypothetical protein